MPRKFKVGGLKLWRMERRLTQQDAAKGLGITRRWLRMLEKGTGKPSLELRFKLARLYDKDISEI